MTAEKILAEAKRLEGRLFWKNACAYVVDKVLFKIGIDVRILYDIINQEWVPDWEKKAGLLVTAPRPLPGDLVFTMWDEALQNHGHIGIYADYGEYFNVSTSAGYKWIRTNVPDQPNVMYRRVAVVQKEEPALDTIAGKMFYHTGAPPTIIIGGKQFEVLSIEGILKFAPKK